MSEKYTYSITTDFSNHKVNIGKLNQAIRSSSITTALDYINSNQTECDIWFKDELSTLDSTTTLPAVIAAHDGEPLPEYAAPTMDDGRPLVRADSRPLDTETYFTMAGDDSTSIGGGVAMTWDFSNDDDLYEGPEVPSGFKAKKIYMTFHCPVHLKDGTVYFFNAPWGCYMSMFVGVPANSYYPNPAGSIPASALGLPGNDMYAYTIEDMPYQCYLNRHHMYGDCPMGDELNAEGAAVNAVPVGWKVCGLIVTPDSDNVSKGYASLEMYRCHTMLLPGQTIESLHS